MAVPLETVVKQLVDSGIIAPGMLANFVPPKANPKSVEELLRELHKQNLLTRFQAQQFAQGRPKSLILGNYTILDKIGAGGMGQVFKAQHRRMDRTVAIKILPPSVTKDAAMVARFEREVRAAAKLEHPNIVTAYDADQANGIRFLVMQFVDGQDLSALVKKNGPCSVQKAVDYILQAARGLEFAHGEGVVHRDIKPANLLLDKKGTVKILDMGLAQIASSGNKADQAELTGTGAVMGTVDYMAPEQARNSRKADARADIYSLGCSLCYLLSAKPVYQADSITSKLIAHQFDPIPSLQEVLSEVPDELEAVFRKMVAKKVEDRYQSMSEVVAALEQCSGGRSTSLSSQQTVDTNLDSSAMMFLSDIPVHTKHNPKPTKKSASTKTGKGNSKMVLSVVVTTVASLAILAGIAISLKSRAGELFIEVNQPDAVVQVWDSEGKIEFSQAGGKGTISISLDPGKHRLKVEKEGYEFFAKEFSIKSGGAAAIRATLVPVKKDLFPAVTAAKKRAATLNDPAFQQWMKDVAALPAEKQMDAVGRKLQERNPGFDGKVTGADGKGTPKIENGQVTEIGFLTDNVTDISPVRALEGLKALRCNGNIPLKGTLLDLSLLQGMKLSNLDFNNNAQIVDLSPLQGMPLTRLDCSGTKVSDLLPLKGMPLKELICTYSQVSDLSPLKGLPLTSLDFYQSSQLSDLSPLQGMQLKNLFCHVTKVSDLSPLKGMPLTRLICSSTQISDLAPLKGMPLASLECRNTQVSNLSPLQGVPLTALSCDGTKISDLSPLKGMKLTTLTCNSTRVSDLSPLQAMPLTKLDCNHTGITSLSALNGMTLKSLDCSDTKVSDLSPLLGMPLTSLNCLRTSISDLTPLKQMKLTSLNCYGTQVTDLSPLLGMPLTSLNCYDTLVSDVSLLANVSTLSSLDLRLTKATASGLATLQKALPNCKIEKPITTPSDPAFQAWLKAVAALPAGQQLEAVIKKLQELNPRFDGKCTPRIENGVITEFGFVTNNVTDISPVRALMGLKILKCDGNGGKDTLFDLSPLKGMKLTDLNCHSTQVSDLSPLQGMPLTKLDCGTTNVVDVSPLLGMKLTNLELSSKVSDLSPLKGMPLTRLRCLDTKVSNLSPLKGMPLTSLEFGNSQVSDLSPLQGMRLTFLNCSGTQVSDLSPLAGCDKLQTLQVQGTKVAPAGIATLQKALPNCKIEWDSGKPRAPDLAGPAPRAGTWQPGPAQGALAGLAPTPAKLPDVGRWNVEPLGVRGRVGTIAVSPDRKRFAVAAGRSESWLRVYDAETGKPLRLLPLAGRTAEAVAWSADGKRLAAVGSSYLGVWDEQGRRVAGFAGHPGVGGAIGSSVAWRPDNAGLAVGSEDGTVRLWNADGSCGPISRGHQGSVASLAWSPDGRLLVSAGHDKTVRLWKADGTAGPVLNGHTDRVTGVAWCHRALTGGAADDAIASVSQDQTIRIWRPTARRCGRSKLRINCSPLAGIPRGSTWLSVAAPAIFCFGAWTASRAQGSRPTKVRPGAWPGLPMAR